MLFLSEQPKLEATQVTRYTVPRLILLTGPALRTRTCDDPNWNPGPKRASLACRALAADRWISSARLDPPVLVLDYQLHRALATGRPDPGGLHRYHQHRHATIPAVDLSCLRLIFTVLTSRYSSIQYSPVSSNLRVSAPSQSRQVPNVLLLN